MDCFNQENYEPWPWSVRTYFSWTKLSLYTYFLYICFINIFFWTITNVLQNFLQTDPIFWNWNTQEIHGVVTNAKWLKMGVSRWIMTRPPLFDRPLYNCERYQCARWNNIYSKVFIIIRKLPCSSSLEHGGKWTRLCIKLLFMSICIILWIIDVALSILLNIILIVERIRYKGNIT
jgi:hypothetical protein